ncbi:hypothetical protein [Dyadobacter beijingensis]|nr:hypothetical protein [Dyadobacter beijingensis]
MGNKNVLLAANAEVMRGDNGGFLAFCTDVWRFEDGKMAELTAFVMEIK